jgi:gliding motility-associated lipoprotein GldH
VYENYYSFENESWNSDSLKSFDFKIMDTTTTYSLSLNVRHSIDYEYQNLFVFVTGVVNDTIELILAEKNGKWKGSGISDVREFTHSL